MVEAVADAGVLRLYRRLLLGNQISRTVRTACGYNYRKQTRYYGKCREGRGDDSENCHRVHSVVQKIEKYCYLNNSITISTTRFHDTKDERSKLCWKLLKSCSNLAAGPLDLNYKQDIILKESKTIAR